jgi:hypothetical protein
VAGPADGFLGELVEGADPEAGGVGAAGRHPPQLGGERQVEAEEEDAGAGGEEAQCVLEGDDGLAAAGEAVDAGARVGVEEVEDDLPPPFTSRTRWPCSG